MADGSIIDGTKLILLKPDALQRLIEEVKQNRSDISKLRDDIDERQMTPRQA